MRTHLFCKISFILGAAAISVACGAQQAQTPNYADVHSIFTANTNTEIPGQSLKPGSYTIHIVDHLKDRYILRVDDTRGNPISTFIGLKNPDFSAGDSRGPVEWSSAPGKKTALRGFVFPKLTVEFVYPKEEAVELAKLNESTVPAIDPQSEGRPLAFKLSEADRQVVTLWMLTPTRVGNGKGTPAIEAERFHAPADTELAENMPPPAPNADLSATRVPSSIAPAAAISNASMNDRSKSRSAIARLPQTASNLPLVLLLSCLFLAAGLRLRGRRIFSPQA